MAKENKHDPIWSSVYVDSGVSCLLRLVVLNCFHKTSIGWIKIPPPTFFLYELTWRVILKLNYQYL